MPNDAVPPGLATAGNAANPNGAAAAADSQPVTLSTEDIVLITAIRDRLPATLGQKVMADSLATTIASDQSPINVRTAQVVALEAFTRPADVIAYAVNDVVGPAVAAVIEFADALRSVDNSGYIVRAQLHTDQTANVALFRLYLFSVAPTPIADNAPFTLLYADAASMIGYIDFPAPETAGAGSTAAVALWTGQIAAAGAVADDKIYGVLVTRTIFTPASGQQFTVALSIDQN